VRLLRSLLILKLGAWIGMFASAAFVRQAVPSRGDAESDEVALVAVLNGIDLKSRAQAFKGGTALAWLGGIALDLREAELAPDARLSVRTFFGGIAIRTPPTWRIEGKVKSVAGGFEGGTPARDDPDAPVLTLDGTTLFGGVAIGAKAPPPGAEV
jgi:hypothetical protein